MSEGKVAKLGDRQTSFSSSSSSWVPDNMEVYEAVASLCGKAREVLGVFVVDENPEPHYRPDLQVHHWM